MNWADNTINDVLLPAVSADEEREYLVGSGHDPAEEEPGEERSDALTYEDAEDEAEIEALLADVDPDDVDEDGYDEGEEDE